MAIEGKEIRASREPYWEEMNSDSKIETLREVVAQTCRVVQRQEELIHKLMEHQHASDGGLMSPLRGGATNQALGYMGGPYTADGGIPFRIRTARERG